VSVVKIQIPDIGDEQEVEVIEILVSPGDEVSENDSLIVLESDKAAMEIPSPQAGVVKEVLVKVGDQVSQGSDIVSIDVGVDTGSAEPESSEESDKKETSAQEAPTNNSITEQPAAAEAEPASSGTASVQEIRVPDLGGDSDVEVIEILVAEGDEINAEDGLVTLESDKAAMDIPSPATGKVLSIKLKVGDKVNEGAIVLELETTAASADTAVSPAAEEPQPESKTVESPLSATSPSGKPELLEIKVPDLGEDSDVEVIDILIAVGDEIKKEDALITLETDKAAMDVPSPSAGVVKAIKVKAGDKVSQGSVILDLETRASESAPAEAAEKASPPPEQTAPVVEKPQAKSSTVQQSEVAAVSNRGGEIYAGPAARKIARELGVDLSKVTGSGSRGRIVKEDVEAFVKGIMQGGAANVSTSGGGLPGIEDVDFSKFGEIEEVEVSKLHKIVARNMSRNWLNVPHVTQFDEADVTELEDFRRAQKVLAEKKGIKLTPLPFIVKACAYALIEHPQFNVSLHSSGAKKIQKKYVHIGIAVATPAGLMVPVLKNVDRKSIWEIAAEIAELGEKAKDRKLSKEEMQGACFTVSSLGNLGGTGFTPIVNAPEVAILGVSKTSVKPVYIDGEFVPRKMLPFALSYDHRAVNGVDGGMFCTYLGSLLNDIRLLAL
jgi:pyruvate dehydrogenase E2 component (dihydrolipoamide acetyltransferase)